MSLEQGVAQHRAHGSLGHSILNALPVAGKDINRLDQVDLAPVADERL